MDNIPNNDTVVNLDMFRQVLELYYVGDTQGEISSLYGIDYGLFDEVDMVEVYKGTYPQLDIIICQIGETSCKFQWKVGMFNTLYLQNRFHLIFQ